MDGSSSTRRVSLCSTPRPVFDELVAREVREGIYRCRIVASLVTEGLIGAVIASRGPSGSRAQENHCYRRISSTSGSTGTLRGRAR